MPYRWGVVIAFVCSLLAITANASCDKFDIRHYGQTLLALNSDTKTMEITHDLELGAISTNQIILGDYLFGVHNVLGEAQLGLRKRKIDADTGKYHVPRAIRGFAHNGTSVIYDHEFRDASEFSLAELRDFMREVLAKELEMEGHNDPFNLATRYTSSGEWCKDTNPLADCVATRDDIFVLVSTEESRIVLADYASSWDRDSQPGDEGYQGSVSTLETTEEAKVGGAIGFLKNGAGARAGSAQFRYTDAEIQDVYWLQAASLSIFEVTPGVIIFLSGWRGGQVIDFSLENGALQSGHFVVGPHPASDPNDIVSVAEAVAPVSRLEVRSPGPVLRFTPGRITRVYVNNRADTHLNVHFGGIITPHDQDGAVIADGTTFVYEFQVPSNAGSGTHLYSASPEVSMFNGVVALPHEHDVQREYVVLGQDLHDDKLNGNTYPGTLERLSGWYLDTMRIKESKPAEDGSGDTLVTIVDEPRLPHSSSNDDALNPLVRDDCPAYGGPILGRFGTGCVVDNVHVHRGHNIPSSTFSPGTPVWIEGHNDSPVASINGMHMVKKEDLVTFRVRKTGAEGSAGGQGGFVKMWRLHKSSYMNPALQNNGASGGYIRFNYGENILLRAVNSGMESLRLHLHGHTFHVVGENGAAVSVTRAETGLVVSPSGSVDAIVAANNPNRMSAWRLGNDAYRTSSVFTAPTPWPDASLVSGGPETWVDYTGFSQGVYALNDMGDVVPFSHIPPKCAVQSTTIQADTDSIGLPFDLANRATFVLLSGSAAFGQNPATSAPFGDDSSIAYAWTVVSTPLGGFATVQMISGGMAYLTSLTTPGKYVVRFTATGSNAARMSPSDIVTCMKEVTVDFCPSGTCAGASDAGVLPFTYVSSSISSLRIGLMDSDVSSSKRNHIDFAEKMPAPVGHATFPTRKAGANAAPAQIGIETAAFFPNNQELRWLSTPGSTFYRWYNDGSNTDFWLDINPATVTSKSSWTYAVKQVVYDARVQTFGGIMGTNTGVNVEVGQTPPLSTTVVYPMYQGLSTFGGDHDVYFLILEASDPAFCAKFDCIYTPSLGLISPTSSALNAATYNPKKQTGRNENIWLRDPALTGTWANTRATDFIFTVDPDTIPAVSASPSSYSPLKWVSWTDDNGVVRHVVANMPFVYWGTAAVQTFPTPPSIVTDKRLLRIKATVGCDNQIRAPILHSSSAWTGTQFPQFGGSCDYSRTGGQLLNTPDFFRMTVTFKTHRAAFSADQYAYFTITDTSDQFEAQVNGIPWTPALNALGRAGDAPYVSSFRVFGNGASGTGTRGHQEDLVGTTPATTSWTPFWQITNMFWNCGSLPFLLNDITGITAADTSKYKSEKYTMYNVVGRADDIYLRKAHVNFPGSTVSPGDPFPLVANMKGASCPNYVMSHNPKATMSIWTGDIPMVMEEGHLFETENPAGSYLASSRTTNSILNAHVPFVWRSSVLRDPEDYTAVDFTQVPPIYQGSWVLLYRPPSETGARTTRTLLYRPLLGGALPYKQMDYGLLGDFPPLDSLINPWKCFSGAIPAGMSSCTPNSGSPLFRLKVPTFTYNPLSVGSVVFTLLECSDAEFSSVFGVRHVANLAKVPLSATSSAIWWTEPKPDENGLFTTASVQAALDSFIFGELPDGTSILTAPSAASSLYSPLRLFSFQFRPVVCNMPITQTMIVDRNDCSPSIRGDLFGSPAAFLAQGPPGCTVATMNLLRSQGGQVVSRSPNSITVKVHRSVGLSANEWFYYTLWDSSNVVTAGYNGVPHSGRLARLAGAGMQSIGVDSIKFFANGANCPGCVEGGPDFQDPIVGVNYSPLHAVTNLLWNCDDVFRGTAATLFTDKNYAGTVGCNSATCDPYPLRVDIKRKLCPQTTGGNKPVYFNAETELVKQGKLFETYTPVGQPTSGKAGVLQEITNTPVVAQVNFGTVSTSTGRHIHIVATDDSNRWVWWADEKPFSSSWMPMVSDGWTPLIPATAASVSSMTVGKIQVKVGDTVSFYTASTIVPHGLVLSDANTFPSAAEAVQNFFSTLYTPATSTTTSSNAFNALYGHAGWSTKAMYKGYLFAGVVRANAVGTRLHFSDPVFGPFAMNGVLELVR